MPTSKKKNAVKKKAEQNTAIEVKLPGAATAKKPLIDKAVSDLNGIYTKKGLETAEAIGGYLIKTFFKGNAHNFHKFSRKHATFKALAEHEGLQFSASYLWFAVPVFEQVHFLRENGIAEELPLSHHRLLVAVRNEKKKLQLAQKAVKKGLSKRAFEEEVRKHKDTAETSSGRPPLPAFAKGFTRLLQAIDIAVSEEVTDNSFLHFDLDKTKELLDQVDAGLAQIQALRESLAGRINAIDVPSE